MVEDSDHVYLFMKAKQRPEKRAQAPERTSHDQASADSVVETIGRKRGLDELAAEIDPSYSRATKRIVHQRSRSLSPSPGPLYHPRSLDTAGLSELVLGGSTQASDMETKFENMQAEIDRLKKRPMKVESTTVPIH